MSSLAQTLIEEEEGRQACVYLDSRNLSTIGIGRLVDRSVPGAGLCDAAIDAQFDHDSARARNAAESLLGYAQCNEVRRAVLVSMCFQLGSLSDWPHFRQAIAIGDFAAAALAGLDSDWAKQTPARAKRQMQMMVSGQWISR